MIELEKAAEVMRRGLELSGADDTEVLLYERASSLTRYSNSAIHQNVAEDDITVSFRLVNSGHTGVASTNKTDEDSLRKAIDRASAFSAAGSADPKYPGLPKPMPVHPLQRRYESTALFGPEERADGVRTVIAKAKDAGLDAAGLFSTSVATVGVANSNGVEVLSEVTEAHLTALTTGVDSTGFAEKLAGDVTEIDPGRVADAATDKATASAKPKAVEPGAWTVILEPAAVAEMLSFLSYVGFGAKSLQENRSFMCGKLDERIVDESVTICDDGLDPRTLALEFDFEGVPKQKVMLIENGVARGVVYDSYTAAQDGRTSTGHGLPAPNVHGPLATSLFMTPGGASLEEMIGSTERGLLVTRFHYTNVEHPVKAIMTGMTRDGTFLVEGGHVTGGVKNMRFTQSILEALSSVAMISAETQLCDTMMGACMAPAIKVDGFNFTGATEF